MIVYSLTGVAIAIVLFSLMLGGGVYAWMMDEPRHPREGWWTEGEPETEEFE